MNDPTRILYVDDEADIRLIVQMALKLDPCLEVRVAESGDAALDLLTADAWQPDLAMMGGLTDCLKLCAWAEQTNTSVSPHFLPALFVHLAHASPAVRWLEDFPTIEALFDAPMTVQDGMVSPATQPGQPPGHGIVWKSGARETYRVI